MNALEKILQYYRRGWRVIPLHTPHHGVCSCNKPGCTSIGKHPRLAHWRDGNKLIPEIQAQQETILHQWFEAWPDMNVGIVTGAVSNLVVLDIDGPEGEESIRELHLPHAPEVQTGKGRHLYFAHPGQGQIIRNLVRIMPGVDIRADGGLVVAPPSIHVSGNVYAWKEGTEQLSIPPCPDWLLQHFYTQEELFDLPSQHNQVSMVSLINEGERNNVLFKLGCSLRAKGLSESAIESALMDENRNRCHPPLPDCEIVAIAKQANKYPAGASGSASDTTLRTSSSPAAGKNLMALLDTFTPKKSEAPDLIGGLFRRGYPSILVAEPGLGKSLLIQRLVCDLSVGGPVFDGFSSSKPMTTLLFCGEAGLDLLNYRSKQTGWTFEPNRISVCDSRRMWEAGVNLNLDSNEGFNVVQSITEAMKPDIVIIDSLGSFTYDESDRKTMKILLDFLRTLASKNKCAVLLVHHLRKRKNGERTMPLDQSEVIGSSILARHAALIAGLEKKPLSGNLSPGSNQYEILVRPLKSWDRPFLPFSFTIQSGDDDRMSIAFDLNPTIGDGKQAQVWSTIMEHYGNGSNFQRGDIVRLCEGISEPYIKKLLYQWVELARLERDGFNRNTTYRVTAPLTGDDPVASGPRIPGNSGPQPDNAKTSGESSNMADFDNLESDAEYPADISPTGNKTVSSGSYSLGNTEPKPATATISGVSEEISGALSDFDFAELDTGCRMDTTHVSGVDLVIPAIPLLLDTEDFPADFLSL